MIYNNILIHLSRFYCHHYYCLIKFALNILVSRKVYFSCILKYQKFKHTFQKNKLLCIKYYLIGRQLVCLKCSKGSINGTFHWYHHYNTILNHYNIVKFNLLNDDNHAWN